MINKPIRIILVVFCLLFSNKLFSQKWDSYYTGLFCKKCATKSFDVDSKEIGGAVLYIGEGFSKYVINILMYSVDSAKPINKTFFFGIIQKNTTENIFTLKDEACGEDILLIKNKKNNWLIKDGPSLIKGLEFDGISRQTIESNRFDKYFAETDNNVNFDSTSSEIEVHKDNVFFDDDGLALYLGSNGHYKLTLGYGNNECYSKCYLISKGIYRQEGASFKFFERGKSERFSGYVINKNTIICSNIPGSTTIFKIKK